MPHSTWCTNFLNHHRFGHQVDYLSKEWKNYQAPSKLFRRLPSEILLVLAPFIPGDVLKARQLQRIKSRGTRVKARTIWMRPT